jgi:hypothetical protein
MQQPADAIEVRTSDVRIIFPEMAHLDGKLAKDIAEVNVALEEIVALQQADREISSHLVFTYSSA